MDTNNTKTLEEDIMEGNFDPKETMDNIQEIMQKANTGCPIHKINFSVESTSAYAGLYLMTLSDPGKFLDDICDMDNINDNTYLYFEPRHIMETAQLLYGVLFMLANNNYIKRADVMNFIDDVVTRVTYCTYAKFKEFLDDTLYKYGWQNIKSDGTNETELKKAAFARFSIIFKKIWFVPYVKVDELAGLAVKEYQERHPEVNDTPSE